MKEGTPTENRLDIHVGAGNQDGVGCRRGRRHADGCGHRAFYRLIAATAHSPTTMPASTKGHWPQLPVTKVMIHETAMHAQTMTAIPVEPGGVSIVIW